MLLESVRSQLRRARWQPTTAAAAACVAQERRKAERVGTVGDAGRCHCACRARTCLCTIAATAACTAPTTIAAAAAAAAAARGARECLTQPAGVPRGDSAADDRALRRSRQRRLLPRWEPARKWSRSKNSRSKKSRSKESHGR